MRRRDLLLLPAAFVAARPCVARTQQAKMPVVGFLAISSRERSAEWLAGWAKGLAEAGFVESRDFMLDYRPADGDPSRFPALAADLVARRVDAIQTTNEGAVAAASKATTTIPIVFAAIHDPVGKGYVKSYNRPGGNLTGVAQFEGYAEKRLELLHEMVPAATRIGYLVSEQDTPYRRDVLQRITAAGKALGVELVVLKVSEPEEVEPVVVAGKQQGIKAVVVESPASVLYAAKKRVVEALLRHGLPSSGGYEFAPWGGLVDYNAKDGSYLAGVQLARVLKGANPAELPVVQPTRFAVAINLKTAKALGLAVPQSLLARADEVIE